MTVSQALLLVGGLVALAIVVGVTARVLGRRARRVAPGAAAPELRVSGAERTIVQFSTEFCARCPGVHRALVQLADEVAGVAVREVDLTHDTDTAARFRVLQTPTVLVLDRDGAIVSRYSGASSAASVRTDLLSQGTPR